MRERTDRRSMSHLAWHAYVGPTVGMQKSCQGVAGRKMAEEEVEFGVVAAARLSCHKCVQPLGFRCKCRRVTQFGPGTSWGRLLPASSIPLAAACWSSQVHCQQIFHSGFGSIGNTSGAPRGMRL